MASPLRLSGDTPDSRRSGAISFEASIVPAATTRKRGAAAIEKSLNHGENGCMWTNVHEPLWSFCPGASHMVGRLSGAVIQGHRGRPRGLQSWPGGGCRRAWRPGGRQTSFLNIHEHMTHATRAVILTAVHAVFIRISFRFTVYTDRYCI